MNTVIEFKNVCKDYYLFDKDYQVLKWLISNKSNAKRKHVLKDISFKISTGEIVGIIGRNGTGKSTILNLIQSTTYPTSGEIKVKGEIGSFINLGAGFFQEYTGRVNIYYKSMLMGREREKVDSFIDELIDFVDIGDYIDMPIKTYSSGMRSRLGFAISVFSNPEIILLDEVFSVGDRNFKEKSGAKMKEMFGSGKTVILTSHSEEQIRNFCTRVIYIENGIIEFDGDADDAFRKYNVRGVK